MQRFFKTIKVNPFFFAHRSSTSSSVTFTPITSLGSRSTNSIPYPVRKMSTLSGSLLVDDHEIVIKHEIEFPKLDAVEDIHGGIVVDVKKHMNSSQFSSLLKSSMSQWKQQGKRGVWIKLPSEESNLVNAAVEEGFKYHHAEPDYLMLTYWIPETVNTLPANASNRVAICAFVMNDKREVLVVQENAGKFKGSGVWKFPTGVVEEGEDICVAAVREVKEETGIESEFVEVLAFRQSHRAFFRKSDLLFFCMLRPKSFDIQKQESEIAAAQWMPIDEYEKQPFIQKNELFCSVANICKTKVDSGYSGFSTMRTKTGSGKKSYLYYNDMGLKVLYPDHQE
jgi:8-oxo-dGTP pyrophosphatase MutT (NUDIX family)